MNAARPVTIGVDLGGTSIRVGVFDAAMTLLESHSMPTRVADGAQSVIEEIADVARMLLARGQDAGSGYEPLGIGIGSPGPINLRTGVLGLLPNFPGWDNFPLRDALAEAAGLPVILEGDANAAAIAEWKMGAAKDADIESMIMLTLGTGVGSGLVLNGKVWHGMYGMAGEVGHATVDPHGLLCGCGSRGCLEMYASANGLMRLARAVAASDDSTEELRALLLTPESATPRHVAALAESGDRAAIIAYERLGWYLGLGIASVINTLDLPLIVVGGGVASAWKLFADAMFQTVRDYSVVYRLVAPTQLKTLEKDCTYICPASLGPQAGLLGAGLLPLLQQTAADREADPINV
jgi:glucokinase